jgi:hypothetical protein
MAASETAKRSIIRGCKYQAIARVIQHDEARLSVGKFIRGDLVGVAATRIPRRRTELGARCIADTTLTVRTSGTRLRQRALRGRGERLLPVAEHRAVPQRSPLLAGTGFS